MSGLSVSRCGLGCVTFGREIDEAESHQILDHAIANGINLIDTADTYGGGNAQHYRLKTLGISDVRERSSEMYSSEKIIGRWLRARRCREKVIIQTKTSGDYTLSHISASIDASLRRLQTDRIDLFCFITIGKANPWSRP